MYALTLDHLLEQARREHGHRTAVLCGRVRLTYDQLYERSLRLARGLRGLGLEEGDRLAVLMLNCHRFLEVYYATALAGVIIVPLNVRWGLREFTHALTDCTPKAFLLDGAILEHLAPHLEALKQLGVRHFLFAGEEGTAPSDMIGYEELLKKSRAEPLGPRAEEEVAGLFYTSGTTGNPKGVMLTHRNLFTNTYHAQNAFRFYNDSIYLHAAPMFHLADGTTTYTVTWNGGTHAFVPRFEEAAVLEAIERWGVSTCLFVPTMINWLLRHPDLKERNLSSLTQIIYGASPMPVEVLKEAMEVFGCKFQQGYGMTEAAPLVSVLTAEDHERALREGPETLLSSAGRPILGVEVRVVDEAGHDLPPGAEEVGEIWVRGPNIMKGYWNLPRETEEALEGGWYHTGDMARRDAEGYLYLVDRKKDMIITGGENVYSTEVEEVLYRHPAVLEAAVIGVPDEKWGEAVKAVVVLKEGHQAGAQELMDHCRQALSGYKVPKSVDFVEELPKGGTGKIQKHVLRERYWKDRERRVH